MLLAVGRMLYEELNDPVFKKRVLVKNGYVGGTTKFSLNFASYKEGSNLRYAVTVLNILLTLLLALTSVVTHNGTYYEDKSTFVSFKLCPGLVLVLQMAYNVFCLFEYTRIYRAHNKKKKGCGFSLQLFAIYFTLGLWGVCLANVLIDGGSTLTAVTALYLFVSIMLDYTNVSCRVRGVSINLGLFLC
jgi:hypothetical protein